MRSLIGLMALLASFGCYSQTVTYPAGIWTGSLVVNGAPLSGTGGNSQSVTIYVLPSGTFYGRTDLIPGDGECLYLISGSLVKGGTQITTSLIAEYGGQVASSACAPTKTGGAIGGSIAKRSGNVLYWTLATPTLTAKYTLSLSTSYSTPSSLKALTGYWASSPLANGVQLETNGVELVLPSGAFSSHDPLLGCVTSGQYTVIDATHNLYTYTETFYDCYTATREGKAFNNLKIYGVATITGHTLHKQGAWGAASIAETEGGISAVGN